MKIVKSNEAKEFKDGNIFVAYEYNTQDPVINTARIEIRGRYPGTGSMKNTQVKELVYVEEGSGEVNINGVNSLISKGDVVFFDKDEQVFWNGNFTLITTCTPAWSPDQHQFL